MWGFKEECRLGFFKGVLLKDPEGILVAPGENSRSSRTLNFTGTVEIERLANVISAYVREAIDLEKAGLKVDLPKDDLDLPAELITALDQDDALRAAFETLTPGRRRGWILHVSQPKQSATRRSRIEKAAPRILAGKGLHDR
ncbi:YdeI/OmpD-associated family protein [Aquibium carbonis]|uniref:YdeI/OmpD-associated family protein n=1 Tax=Aquibium carbonis TaxID=2495581 RepID=UPI001FE231D7|nr:YdeI/OmpD-associated family protein [Aquibium carbonis]